ncbi:MFS transporter [Hwanghaeella grinnelliae]|uniref:MFS transporter n=1 Tax=Hwanghaeella grinnelliae TaxID=2500179 RepID=A0A3S2Z745_9PROT|nr:AmpG family muropeptide MFS transporter [Hwanghaeella grinnelliae]RVU36173.1 MFS transporter [Hwanghaeella grinnelliae]
MKFSIDKAVKTYLDPRIWQILGFGFVSGLPLALTTGTLTYWLAREGVDKTAIGLFALLGIPYAFKFLWAPLLDHLPAPPPFGRLGRRRGWAIVIQLALMAALLAMGAADPNETTLLFGLAGLSVAFLSASQDIVIDAFRIELLDRDEQGAGAAAIQLGYRLGMLVSGAGAIWMSAFLPWFWVYAGMAACLPIGMLLILTANEPAESLESLSQDRKAGYAEWLKRAVVAPFLDFMKHPGWIALLAFALLYKFGDAIGGIMANPFYVEMGFSAEQIASVTKFFGLGATILGTIAGGALVAGIGLIRALVIAGILQAVTNLLFALLAANGADVALLALAVGADNFTGGLGSAAFVAYLSSLCSVAHTGTQYALLTSLMALGRSFFSSGGGWLADQMDWVTFFIATTGLAVPGLLLLWLIARLPERLPAREPGQRMDAKP